MRNIGAWCNGSMRVSKTPDEGSIPSAPAYSFIIKEIIWLTIQ